MVTGFLASLWPVRGQINKAGIPHEVVDITAEPDARDHVLSLGYLQAPVVIAGDQHWSGFRPDRIKALVKDAVFASNAS